jgi:hypothetical protein
MLLEYRPQQQQQARNREDGWLEDWCSLRKNLRERSSMVINQYLREVNSRTFAPCLESALKSERIDFEY